MADVYQEKMSLLFIDLEEVKVNFDDTLVLGFGSFEDHVQIFTRSFLLGMNQSLIFTKCKFVAIETEYLGLAGRESSSKEY